LGWGALKLLNEGVSNPARFQLLEGEEGSIQFHSASVNYILKDSMPILQLLEGEGGGGGGMEALWKTLQYHSRREREVPSILQPVGTTQ
jgi:hypothetical protein